MPMCLVAPDATLGGPDVPVKRSKGSKTAQPRRTASKPPSRRPAAPRPLPRPAPAPASRGARAPGAETIVPPVRTPLPARVLFASTNILFHALQETLGASAQSAARFGLGRALVLSRGYDKFALMRGAVGAPAAAVVLEEAIAAGAKEVVILGPAVAFAPQIAVGDLIVPTESVIADGTSPYYVSARSGATPDAALRGTVAHLLERSGASFRTGRIASVDAVYVRPAARLATLRRARVLAVDMELAALLSVCRFRGVRAAALIVVSSPPSGIPTELGPDRPLFLNAVIRAASALAAWPETSAGSRR